MKQLYQSDVRQDNLYFQIFILYGYRKDINLQLF